MALRLVRWTLLFLGAGVLVGFLTGLFRRHGAAEASGYAAPRPSADRTANRADDRSTGRAERRDRAGNAGLGR